MSHSQNIHPRDKWQYVVAKLNGPREGASVVFELRDEGGQYFNIALHYGGEGNAAEFVFKLKEAVVGLSVENTEKED